MRRTLENLIHFESKRRQSAKDIRRQRIRRATYGGHEDAGALSNQLRVQSSEREGRGQLSISGLSSLSLLSPPPFLQLDRTEKLTLAYLPCLILLKVLATGNCTKNEKEEREEGEVSSCSPLPLDPSSSSSPVQKERKGKLTMRPARTLWVTLTLGLAATVLPLARETCLDILEEEEEEVEREGEKADELRSFQSLSFATRDARRRGKGRTHVRKRRGER